MNFEVSPAEVAKVLKPVVPGLDRRDQAAHIVKVKPAPKALFGRKPRATPSAELTPPAKMGDEESEMETPIASPA